MAVLLVFIVFMIIAGIYQQSKQDNPITDFKSSYNFDLSAKKPAVSLNTNEDDDDDDDDDISIEALFDASEAENKPVPPKKPRRRQASARLSAKDKGTAFEDYVVNFFEDKSKYDVLDWNPGQTSTKGVYAESTTNPDIEVRQKLENGRTLKYYIECKFRSQFNDEDCIVVHDYQLERYRQHQRQNRQKLLLAIGVGENPADPSSFYLIPIEKVTNENISKSTLEPFTLANPKEQIFQYVSDWFLNEVFKKKRT